jgi:hypothetical protein
MYQRSITELCQLCVPAVPEPPLGVEVEEDASLIEAPVAVDAAEEEWAAVGVISPEPKGTRPAPIWVGDGAVPVLVVLWIKRVVEHFTRTSRVPPVAVLVGTADELRRGAERVCDAHMGRPRSNHRHEREQCQRHSRCKLSRIS